MRQRLSNAWKPALAQLIVCAATPLFASTPASTFADLDGRPGLEFIAAPKLSSNFFTLEPRDLDRDADLDIVLRHRLTHQDLAWWRNDGHGHLTRGESRRLTPGAPFAKHRWRDARPTPALPRHLAFSPAAALLSQAAILHPPAPSVLTSKATPEPPAPYAKQPRERGPPPFVN